MADDLTISELVERSTVLRQKAAELFADQERLQDELMEIFERIKKLHYQPPVLTDPPPEPPL
jgi:hypothetical protein